MQTVQTTPTQNTTEKRTNKARRKAVRLNDRILTWTVDLFARKTQSEVRTKNYGTDPLA